MTSSLRVTMVRLAFVFATAIAAVYAVDVPESSQNQASTVPVVDLNKTVLEVEKILDNYPELPRIERSEILTILQNITEEDNKQLTKELSGVLEEEQQKMKQMVANSTRTEGKKSVMVVLPFKADSEGESLEELYTRSPVVVMEEEQKRPDKVFSINKPTEPPSFSIVEKEDPKFNPPLRVIGFRYHTTQRPNAEETTRSYTNFQDPEQVTMMAFRAQEATTRHWNHRETPTTMKPAWGDNLAKKPAEFTQTFHVPDAMDNFSIEDVMLPSMDQKLATTAKTVADIETSKYETTTDRVYITSAKPRKRKTTTTEESFWSTTEAPKPKKQKPITKKPIFANTLDNLPPHLKEMLNSIGINDQSSLTDVATDPPPPPIIRTANANINPASYSNFRPLPLKKQKTVSDDMQKFLASFGLLDNNSRHQKSADVAEATTEFSDKYLHSAPKINADFLTDTMKKTLENLGLYDESEKPKNSRVHIFNPKNHTTVQSEEEIKKLNTLLTTIKKLANLNDSDPVTPEFQRDILQQVKELDNITISYKTSEAINEEIHKIIQQNKGKFKIPVVMKESTAVLPLGPDPEYFEEILLKNEVKRQEENITSTTEAETSDSATTTTTEPANSAGLEDSFGGGGVAPADANPADSLPPKRPNGLYLLLDWNTFFEVGTEDDRRRVNIRFQPKIGDGRNFLPVTIP